MQDAPYIETNTEVALAQSKLYHAGKRALDITLSLLALVLLSPVCALVAGLIKLNSAGPVFFRQTRLGTRRQTFHLLQVPHHAAQLRQQCASELRAGAYPQRSRRRRKLNAGRRLQTGAGQAHHRVGAILRKTSLDEIPQLFNVLKGEMSLVGPRPPLPYEVEVYQDWHKKRLDVIPGITGLWQVQGRSRVSFDEMVRMDLDYAAQSSLWLDLKIIVLTIPAVLTGSGAR